MKTSHFTSFHRCGALLASIFFINFLPAQAPKDSLRATPEGQVPKDGRLGDPVTLHDYHPFRPVASKAEWEVRQKQIVNRMILGCGLWPEPTKTALNPVVHKKIDKGDYTVEAVFFESFPGHFVTGSLYRPTGKSLEIGEKDGKRPGVLCPHGHWSDGRFYNQEIHRGGMAAVNRDLAIGAERFVNAARSPLQARCVQLARMGCVVFFYDMLGNADSDQFAEHRRGPRPQMQGENPGEWGFVSKQATARLQTNFGLQTWNSIRAVDFITGLEEVDSDRILVTGASGGATQTMMVSAIDERVDAAFPCVMVSTAMQGGCTCENTHFLRIGQGNIDIAAAVAPRPQGLTAADDWTVELETKGHPDLVNLYEMIGAKGNYEAHFDIHFKHNYNHVSRTHMYNFVNRHFGLGLKPPVLERDFEILSEEEMTVYNDEHPKPSGDQVGDAHEKALNQWWAEDSDKQVAPLLAPKTAEEFAKTKEVIGGAWEILIGRDLPEEADVNFGLVGKEKRNGFIEMSGLIGNDKQEEEIPAAFLFPGENWNGHVVIWLTRDGKSGLFDAPGTPKEEIAHLVDHGIAVMGLDLFQQGEFLNAGKTPETAGRNPEIIYSKNQKTELPLNSWQRSPVYYYGYNHSTFARRVHDVLTALAFAKTNDTWEVKKLSLGGDANTGHWVAAARAIGGESVDKAWIDTGGFRFETLDSHWHADFIPGAVKYGDMAGLLVLNAPYDSAAKDPDSGSLDAAAKAAGGKFAKSESAVEYLSE
ncbi:MAG: acetylxylan esterase [Verrucomicrobiales bacterium]|nr:acetylxylan esterase [Verrucomicrobiales bacterium]